MTNDEMNGIMDKDQFPGASTTTRTQTTYNHSSVANQGNLYKPDRSITAQGHMPTGQSHGGNAVLTIDITSACNHACEFCYQTRKGQLSLSTVLDLARKHTAETVELGGGEPFLHPDFIKMIRGIRDMGKDVHIATNGSVIPRSFYKLSQQARRDSDGNGIDVQVSMHAPEAGLHKTITGVDDFDVIQRNIKQLRDNYQTSLSANIYSRNKDAVPDLLALAERLGLPLRINLVFPIGKGKSIETGQSEEVSMLWPSEVDRLRGYLLEQRALGRKVDSPLIHDNVCTALERYYSMPKTGKCPMVCGKRYISPDGKTHKCEFGGSR